MKKYKVTQKFMDGLNEWRSKWNSNAVFINDYWLEKLPNVVHDWRFEPELIVETNQRLGAIINWVNGEDVFEVTPKYIVQRRDAVSPEGREYLYIFGDGSLKFVYSKRDATKFDEFMKAREWAGIHFEVVEVDE